MTHVAFLEEHDGFREVFEDCRNVGTWPTTTNCGTSAFRPESVTKGCTAGIRGQGCRAVLNHRREKKVQAPPPARPAPPSPPWGRDEQRSSEGGARSALRFLTHGRLSERSGRRPRSEFGRAPPLGAAQCSRPAGPTATTGAAGGTGQPGLVRILINCDRRRAKNGAQM